MQPQFSVGCVIHDWSRRAIGGGRIGRLLCLLGALMPITARAQARWSDPATWGGQLPAAGATITIPAGRTVVLDAQTPALAGLRIQGTLVAANADVAITAGYIIVDGGRLEIGTATTPFARRAVITLTGTTTAAPTPSLAHFGNKVLAVQGGSVSLHGREVGTAWTRLAADVTAGAGSITLADAPRWSIGDRLVVATSTRQMNQTEVVEIAAINGSTVTLARPLQFSHLGTLRRAGDVSVDVRAEVGLLTHNIVVQGDEQSESLRIGGHAMFMNGATPATVQLARVTFRRMGQFNLTGRYPVHFHMMGAMRDSYVRQVAIDGSIQRGIVLHAVRGVQATGNVIYNTVGHNFVVEDAATTDNVIDRNLALVNRFPLPLQTTPDLRAQNDRMPSNFWFKSGRNTVTGNAAAGSLASGFNYDGIGAEPVNFRRNVAHAAMGVEGPGAGDFDLAAGVLLVSEAARSSSEVIGDALVYHNAIGMWPEETGTFLIDRMIAADNDLHTENRGVGNRVTYRAATFVGTLTESRANAGTAVHFQYGSDVRLENPYFVNFTGGSVLASTDIGEVHQATLVIGGARWSGSKPGDGGVFSEDMLVTHLDDALMPAGTYVPQLRFAGVGCTLQRISLGSDDSESTWKCPRQYRYSELDMRDRSVIGTKLHMTTPLHRSDGATFTGGMFGYTAILDGGVSYEVARPGAEGYAFRLTDDAVPVIADGRVPQVRVVVPYLGTLGAVYRGGRNAAPPLAPSSSTRLRQATSDADFAANPLTTFLLDATARKLTVNASPLWLSAFTTSGSATVSLAAACPTARDAAVAQMLAHARREPIADVNRDGRKDLADLVVSLNTAVAPCR